MLITPAYAQAAGGAPDVIMSIVPFILIFVIMWFLIIRPQRQRMKAHQEMVNNVRRGDTIVTSGGLIGKVAKVVDEGELLVDIADSTRVRVARAMINEVRAKGEPVKDGE